MGVWAGSTNNKVWGNYIGTNAAGTSAVPNANEAVWLDGPNNLVGGSDPGKGNLISGNSYSGVAMSGTATGNTVQGNYIGTDVTGNVALPNYNGISLYGSSGGNTIGGTAPGAGNLISGNHRNSDADGIFIGAGSTNVVQGNYIGTNAAGTGPLGNASDGIWVGGSNNTIGGTAAGAGNLISGNTNGAEGIGIGGNNNVVKGNRIGTDATGNAPLPNSYGIVVYGGAGNAIGGSQAVRAT